MDQRVKRLDGDDSNPGGDAAAHIGQLSHEVRALIGAPLPPFLRSRRPTAACAGLCSLTDPSTGTVFARVVPGSDDDVDMAVVAALDVMQGEWGACSAPERERLLFRFADLIERYQQPLAELEALGSGRALKPVLRQGVPETLAWCRYLAGLPTKMDGHTSADPGALEPFRCSFREPGGVAVLRVQAEHSLTRRLVPVVSALTAGCAVLLLCDDASYPTLYYLCGLLVRAGIPEDAVSLLWEGPETRAQLLAHDRVFSPVLGVRHTGPAPSSRMLVFEDADIDQVVETLLMRVLSPLNPSQITPRLHVHDTIYDELIEAIEGRLRSISIGAALDPKTELGPGCHADRARQLVALCREEGLRVVCGGDGYGEGHGMVPTLIADDRLRLAHVSLSLPVPVLLVQPFGYEERIVRRANRDLGCQGVSLFTQQLSRIRRLSRSLRTEQLWINSHYRMEPGDQWDPLAPYLRRRTIWMGS